MSRKRPAVTISRSIKPLSRSIRSALEPQRPAASIAAGIAAVGFTLNSSLALAALFPEEFELSTLQSANGGDGSDGFVLNGIDFSDRSGFSVSAAGDVNGDGIGDLMVGATPFRPSSSC